MKSFLYNTLSFIILPLFLLVFVMIALKIKANSDIEKHQIIILGDSQTEFIRFPEVYNYSIHGSPYYVHYEFAKKFIDQIKNKTVYIACNYHNLSKLYQNRLANEKLLPGWRANTFKIINEYNIYNDKYSDIRPKDLNYSFFSIKKAPRLFKKLFITKANKNSITSTINDTLKIDSAIKNHWTDPKYILEDSIQREYLNKLIVLLEENNCDVVLLKMPLTNYYTNNVPIEIKKELTFFPKKHKIRMLDLNNSLKISKDYLYFKDYGHLNLKGDSLVTKYFKKYEIKARIHNNVYN